MKNLILAICCLSTATVALRYEHTYIRKNCIVTQVNDGYATIQDYCGFSDNIPANGLKPGDIVNLKMHDNYSANCIEDDIIICVK